MMGRVGDSSIKRKLTWLSLLASGSALLLACAAFVAYDLVTFRAGMARGLSVQADIVGANSLAAILFDDAVSAAATLGALRAEPRIVVAAVYTRDGRVFARYARDGGAGDAPVPEPAAAAGHEFGRDSLSLSRPIVSEGQTVGMVYIRSDLQEMYARLARYLAIVAGVMLAALLLASAISSRLQRTIAEPIAELAGTARAVSTERDYSVRAVARGRGEVGVLIHAFNEMLAQIQRRDADLREARSQLERRVAERTRQLEAANAELEAFTYTVSHDLKAPLRGLEGFARALGEDYGDRFDDQGRRYLGFIQGSARRMEQLIEDLLRYSRLERRELKLQGVSLPGLVDEIRQDFEEEIRARGVTVRVEAGVESIEAEREGLREALANLLDNALKFTRGPGGTITIGSRRDADAVVLWVADSGIGFDMKYHDRIFGIFERLHRQEDYPGTGVGLAIVRKVAERHGGRAWAESQAGKGSTFHLSLPIRTKGHP